MYNTAVIMSLKIKKIIQHFKNKTFTSHEITSLLDSLVYNSIFKLPEKSWIYIIPRCTLGPYK